MAVLELGNMVPLDMQGSHVNGSHEREARADRAIITQAKVLTSFLRPQGEPTKGLKAAQQGLFAISLEEEWGGRWLGSQARARILLGLW